MWNVKKSEKKLFYSHSPVGECRAKWHFSRVFLTKVGSFCSGRGLQSDCSCLTCNNSSGYHIKIFTTGHRKLTRKPNIGMSVLKFKAAVIRLEKRKKRITSKHKSLKYCQSVQINVPSRGPWQHLVVPLQNKKNRKTLNYRSWFKSCFRFGKNSRLDLNLNKTVITVYHSNYPWKKLWAASQATCKLLCPQQPPPGGGCWGPCSGGNHFPKVGELWGQASPPPHFSFKSAPTGSLKWYFVQLCFEVEPQNKACNTWNNDEAQTLLSIYAADAFRIVQIGNGNSQRKALHWPN